MPRVKFLIRPHAWWYNKIPLSVFLVFWLIADRPFSLPALITLFGVVITVCGVANYGYALNELYDKEEDLRAGRNNAAFGRSDRHMWVLIVGSAAVAVSAAALSGGITAATLVLIVLVLPFTYSVPPFRTKERGWFGALSDALAAHVFPAALAITVLSHWGIYTSQPWLTPAILGWAFATGLRGILSHQLHDDNRDLAAGLVTVAHGMGHDRLSRLVILVILPIEIAIVMSAIFMTTGHFTLKLVVILYCAIEIIRFYIKYKPMYKFTRWWSGYIPFADEALYKVWGPIALGVDLVLASPFYMPVVMIFLILFWPRIRAEGMNIKRLAVDLEAKIAGRQPSA